MWKDRGFFCLIPYFNGKHIDEEVEIFLRVCLNRIKINEVMTKSKKSATVKWTY